MHILKSDLFRPFAIGFALGVIGLCAVFGTSEGQPGSPVIPQAIAAPAH